jgi:hypothetical protein
MGYRELSERNGEEKNEEIVKSCEVGRAEARPLFLLRG